MLATLLFTGPLRCRLTSTASPGAGPGRTRKLPPRRGVAEDRAASLSRGIKELEEQVGLPLFTRSRTGHEPTDFGQVFVQHAIAVLVGRPGDWIAQIAMARALQRARFPSACDPVRRRDPGALRGPVLCRSSGHAPASPDERPGGRLRSLRAGTATWPSPAQRAGERRPRSSSPGPADRRIRRCVSRTIRSRKCRPSTSRLADYPSRAGRDAAATRVSPSRRPHSTWRATQRPHRPFRQCSAPQPISRYA